MKPWITVLTTPKRNEYLPATIASLERAGALAFDCERIIFVDGTPTELQQFPGWRTCQLAPGPLGVRWACFRLLQSAAHAGAPFVIYNEDDVTYCRNAIPAIASFPVPDDIAFVSFCDIKQSAEIPGLAVALSYDFEAAHNQGGHWGNQTVLIPYRSLERLTKMEPPKPDWKIKNGIASDILLGMALGNFGVFNPSLAQHTGANSTVTPDAPLFIDRPGRMALSYPGDNFDALSLDLSNVRRYDAKRTPGIVCDFHGGVRHGDGLSCPR